MRMRLGWPVMLCLHAFLLRADLVVMQSGDRYNGKVLSITGSNVVFQSEILGRILLPRGKVAQVSFGTNVVASPASPAALPSASAKAASTTNTNKDENISATLRQLGAHTNLIQKVQKQFPGAASPEASAKIFEMLNDLSSGKMTMADLRAQAKDAADQLRALQRESGEGSGFTADVYLAILDRFLGETDSTSKPMTNSGPR